MAASGVTDTAGNNIAQTDGPTVTIDRTVPTVTFDLQAGSDSGTSSTDNITNVASPVFDASFSEAVAGFAAGDLSNTGTATGCSFAVGAPTGNTYPVTVTLCTEGTLIVRMAASGVTDTAGNNIAQTDGPTVTIDRTVPTITIANPTTTPEQSKTITASTSDGTLTMSNTTGSTCDGSLTFIAYSSQTFILESDNGTKVCYRAIDTAGNTAYSLSNAIAGIDTTAPTVAIDQAVGQADPTNASPIDFTVVFSESVSGFINTDVTLSSGTAVVTGGPTTYNVAVSGMSQGVLTASIGAGVATDTAGNGNIASSSTDNSVTYDNVGPTVTSDQAVGQADPTNASPIDFTVIFSESVIGFGSVDVDLSGSAGATTATVTGSGATYNVAVSGMTGDGTVIANVKAGAVQDALGNDSAASTSSDNQVIYDTTALTVVIDTHPADPTSSTSAAFTFTTSGSPVEIDCKLDLGAYMACDTGSTQSYAGPLADGSHTFTVRVTDLATNSSSATYSWVIDTTAPVIVTAGIGSVPDSGDGSIAENEIVTVGLIQLLVSFSEDVYNPAGNSDPDDATNPDNYLLVRDNDDGIQTASCIGGVTGGDIQITINSITYSNNSGVGPFVATLNMNGGIALPNGTYRLIVCGTTSITDLVGISLAGDGVTAGTDFTRNFGVSILVAVRALPATGFAPNRVTVLPFQPDDKAYSAMGDLWLEIPKLGVKMNIVGVPQTKGGWDVSWLGSNAGWLQGSAYPTWAGNSVLTGHVWNADNTAGPFRYINTLWYGDKVIIHAGGALHVYEVRSVLQVGPGNVNALMKHEELPWVTLVTCRGYDTAAGTYEYRVLVRAVLVEVK
jgi:LPXTG-site transpeptidase (sortase) family protein